MPANLSATARTQLFNTGHEVYSAYLLLDMVTSHYYVAKSRDFDVNGAKTSLKEYITAMIKNGSTQANFRLGDKPCQIQLIALPNNEWSVKITSTEPTKPTELKPIHQYRPDDLINCCNKYPLKVSLDDAGDYKFSAELTVGEKKLSLGGKGKIDLFQLHISNLYTILTRINDPKMSLDMLVAMATGSGKSFTQALWFLIQYLSGNPCFFAVPTESLVVQLKRDFERLLPTEVTQEVTAFQVDDPIPTREAVPRWAIMSHQKLFQDFWDYLQDERTKQCGMLLCLDEEHVSAKEELLNKRSNLLAEHYPMMFLSATPSAESYQISGGQPVANLSLREKEELGISKSAVSKQATAKGSIRKGRKSKPLSILNSLIMNFVNSIEEERLSTAHEYVDQSETLVVYRQPNDSFYVQAAQQEIRRFMRWNIQAAIGEKALVLVDRHDPVINLALLRDGQTANPYKNGNRVERDNVYEFFQLGTVLDTDCIDNYNQAKVEWRKQQFLKPLEKHFAGQSQQDLCAAVEAHVDLHDTSAYMEFRVLHGLIENTLTYLLGYDSKQLDDLRFRRFDDLLAEVEQKLQDLTAGRQSPAQIRQNIITALLQDKLPLAVAEEVATAMSEIIKILKEQPYDRRMIVDNWSLDKKLHELFIREHLHGYGIIKTPITQFINKYKTIFIVNGLEKSPTCIASNRAFFHLTESKPKMDDPAIKSNAALRHKYSPLEALDDTMQQAVYTPNYCPDEFTPAVIDTLFRKGLIGTYVTSEKVTGFNDPNLHHVSMIVNDPEDPMNAPDQIIQGSGRNRGLNPAHQPFFFLTSEGTTPLGFLPQTLGKKNYYPDFFKAKKVHHRKMTQWLGKMIATEMKDFIEANVNPDGTIDTDKFENKLRDIVLLAFEEVYRNNNFDFKKTRKIFSKVLGDVHHSLYAQSLEMKKVYKISSGVKIIANVLDFLATCYYKLSIARSSFDFFMASRKLTKKAKDNPNLLPETTYAHIVRAFKYKNLIAMGAPAKRLRDLIKKDAEKSVRFALEKHPEKYVKSGVIAELKDVFKNELSSYFIRFVGTSQQQLELLQLITAKDDWFEKFFPHLETLTAKNNEAVKKYFLIIQSDSDIANYFVANNLRIEFDRPNKISGILIEMQQKIMQLMQSGNLTQANLSAAVIESLDGLQFLFHPKDAVFLLQHKNAITINMQAAFAAFQSINLANAEKIPEIVVSFLRSSLPKEVQEAADRENCLQPSDYTKYEKFEQLEKKLSDPKNIFDYGIVRDFMANNLNHYFQNPAMKRIVNEILGSFTEEQLKTLLGVIYPNESDNLSKARKLQEFRKNFNSLSSQELFEKYASFTDPNELEDTDISKLFKWIFDLFDEILVCQCHWHSMSEKGGEYDTHKAPKLKGLRQHAIWEMHGTLSDSASMAIAKKTQFLKATQTSFEPLNHVEGLGNRHTILTLAETACTFVQPLKQSLDGSTRKVSKKASAHQQTLFHSAQELGRQMRIAKSLTAEEVRSPQTTDLNAVQRMQRLG